MKDDRLYLAHNLDCVSRIEQYTIDGKESFLASTLVQDAVIRNLQTMAESSQRIFNDTKATHPEIDWRGLAAIRNILVHDYLGTNLLLVWELIVQELADLKRNIEAMLSDMDHDL